MCLFLLPLLCHSTPYCSWTPLNPPEPPPQLTEFPQFSLLPLEIRLRIWSAAAQVPRLVHITRDSRCSNGVPAILRACHESRQVALPRYFLHFRDRNPPFVRPAHLFDPWNLLAKLPRPKPFYLDHSRDTFRYDIERFSDIGNRWPQDVRDLARVKRLAVSNTWWQWANESLRRHLALFAAVEELVLVMDDCRGNHIEIMRTRDISDVVEWSEDGKMLILRTGKLVDKFREEIESAYLAETGRRPQVCAGMVLGPCVVSALSSR